MINVALPKGRLGEKIYAKFEQAGYECPSIKENNRKLIFENAEKGIRYFWVKPSDVSIYVERGAADIGVCGKDILAEYAPDVYELLDLKKGVCKMAVAAKKHFYDDRETTLKVATKFVRVAKAFYAAKGREITIRTFDIGADKPLERLQLEKEPNPAMGMRGVRLMYTQKEIFRTQIEALLIAADRCGKVNAMLPMVTL
jgi:ATP phosphoribosyltransferase